MEIFLHEKKSNHLLRRWGATPDPGEAPPLAGF
jgi:hypothetical protein